MCKTDQIANQKKLNVLHNLCLLWKNVSKIQIFKDKIWELTDFIGILFNEILLSKNRIFFMN